MSITHHPDVATLLGYASGTIGEAPSAVIAAHLASCGACRREVGRMERLGGVLIAALEPAANERGAMPVPAVDTVRELPARRPERARTSPDDGLPAPLRRLLPGSLAEVPWRWVAPGIRRHELPLSPGARGYLSLLRIEPGRAIPEHGHGAVELTLVLTGSFRDSTGHYGPGDVADVDDTIEHTPVVDSAEPCICLIASEERPQFKGLAGRLMQRLTG